MNDGSQNAGYHAFRGLEIVQAPTDDEIIPEPATIGALALAAAGLGAYVRRRKQHDATRTRGGSIMRTQRTGMWTIAVVGLAAVLALSGAAKAAWVDNFDQAAFDARWGQDEPNPALGTVTLDTANDWAHFTAMGNTDMWTVRNNAPILCTASPAGDFFIETHVAVPTSQDRTVSALTVYGNGSSDDGKNPNLTLGLDHWSGGNRMVKLQGLGTNDPNIFVPATGGEAWLRLELERGGGAGGVDRYRALYKLQESDPWHPLGFLDRNVDNARMGLVQKTNPGGRSSDFTYAASDALAPAAPAKLWNVDIEATGSPASMSGEHGLSGQGNVWNAFTVAHHAGTSVNPSMNLVDTDGNATGVTFAVDGTVSGWNNSGSRPVVQDYLFIQGGSADPDIDWSLAGLTPGETYEMLIYGPASDGRGFNMTIDSDGDADLSDEILRSVGVGGILFAGLVPAADGTIIGSMTNRGQEGNWAGFQLAQLPSDQEIIPEPATMALLGLAVVGLGGYVRRRRRVAAITGVVLAAGMLLVGAGAAEAASITLAGTIADDAANEITQWRTATTPKTLDADGNNIYGSDAKLFYTVMGDYGSYVQYITSESQVGPYGGYAVVDHPDDSSPDLQVRTTTSGNTGGAGNLRNMFTFSIPATPPPLGFRVGVAFDGLDGAQFSPQEIRLTQTTGGSASASVTVEPFRNNTLDMAFFDVTGAAVNDRFTVQGVTGAGGYATHQIVTWDSLTAPPAPLAAGDVIKLDFSTAGDGDGPLPNWNSVANSSDIINPVRHSDGTGVAGVAVRFTNMMNGQFNNDGNAANWAGTAGDPYYSLGADDIYFHGQGADLMVTVSGLDPSLTYNARIYSLISGQGTTDRFVVTDGAGTQSVENTRDFRWAAATLEDAGTVFTGLSLNASNELLISVEDVGSVYYPLNAIVLEAVGQPDIIPEPATMAMLALAAAGLGAYVRRRRQHDAARTRGGSIMRTQGTGMWMIVVVGLAAVLALSGAARADWVDNFDQATFDARWGLDVPDAGQGNVTLDTGNDWAQFQSFASIDMWTARRNAPILWTPSSSGDFHLETHVTDPVAQNGSVAGITVYNNNDAINPNFSLGLDQWGGPLVKLQGLGTNNPNTSTSIPAGQAWLRLECTRDGGAGGVDLYTAKYKLNAADPWTTLTTLERDVPNARMGLFLKASDTGRTAEFTYAAGSDPAPGPQTVWDFELGDLTGWNIVNTVHGDDAVFTTAGNMPTQMPATGFDNTTVQGQYFIRTWDGNVLGNTDGPTGIIESDSFVVGDNARMEFLMGGGNHPFAGDPDTPGADITAMNLERMVATDDWEMIMTATGTNANVLSGRVWDLDALAGETVRLRIYDTHQGGWGHIDVDSIQYFADPVETGEDIPEPATMAMLALAAAGLAGYARKRRRA